MVSGGELFNCLRFLPTDKGGFASSFNISSTDPDEGLVTVHVSGRGVEFLIDPEEGTIGTEV